MTISLKVTGTDDLRRASRKIRESADPKTVRRELSQALKQSTTPALTDAKAAALALPAHGRHHTGLRVRIARGVTAQAKLSGRTAGVKVRVSRRIMGSQAAVPMLMNHGNWRHPVFGETKVWVTQRGSRNWFDSAVDRHRREVRRAVKGVLDDLERKLKT